MTKTERFVKSLGIPKTHKCSSCKNTTYFAANERHLIADCMMNNCKGIWCLVECFHCGYTEIMYPNKINGIECTDEECDKLFKELNTIS